MKGVLCVSRGIVRVSILLGKLPVYVSGVSLRGRGHLYFGVWDSKDLILITINNPLGIRRSLVSS